MLVFDIETTGLDPNRHSITVIAVCDTGSGDETVYTFARDGMQLAETFLASLDHADIIACFNGVQFDLPFVVSFFSVPECRYRLWFCKVFDYYEYCRLLFDCPCSLNRLLNANGHAQKTSSGGQAVVMAAQEDWQQLEDYCLADTTKTRDICLLTTVSLPLQKLKCVYTCRHVHNADGQHSLRFDL
jgi:hypothetical protein